MNFEILDGMFLLYPPYPYLQSFKKKYINNYVINQMFKYHVFVVWNYS